MAFKDIKYMKPYIPYQKYEDRVVAFIDLLGFSEMVAKTVSDEKKLQSLTGALESFYNIIWEWEANGIFSSFAFTQFSDSIVISARADSTDSFGMLMQLLIAVMALVDNYDVLVRGGITRGQLIHDRTMLVGPAMVDAYHMESQKAKYPRIIIDEDLKRQFDENIEDYIKNHTSLSEVPGFNQLFKLDEDGWYYLDYIKPAQEYNNELSAGEHLKKLGYIADRGMQSDSERVREKYDWLKKKVEEAMAINKAMLDEFNDIEH